MSTLHELAKKCKREVEELMGIYANFVDKINGREVYKGHKMKADTLEKFKQLETKLNSMGYK